MRALRTGPIIGIVLAVHLMACAGADPTEPDRKSLQVHSASPSEIPYGIPSEMLLNGENLDGVAEVFFLSSEGAKPGVILSGESTTMRVRAPSHEWFGRARVAVSEGSESYHLKDTLPGYISLVGPAHPSMSIYEARGNNGELWRWSRDRFPLRVFLAPFSRPEDRSAVIEGILTWSDVIASAIPSFEMTEDSLNAEILVVPATRQGATVCNAGTPERTPTADPLRNWIELAVIECSRDFFEGVYIERDLRVLGAHEVGHALGILRHSQRETDIMSATSVVEEPSTADLESIQFLYNLN